MNITELKIKKQELIEQGLSQFDNLAIITDTLGEYKIIDNRLYWILDYDGITLMHYHQISHASTKGSNQAFVKWVYSNHIFISVGDYQKIGNKTMQFRKDYVANLYLVNDDCDATPEQVGYQIFVPYHMDWFNRIMVLLPKAQSILGNASKEHSAQEVNVITKQLFLDVHPEYQINL